MKAICEQFIADRDMLKKVFKMENSYVLSVSALTLRGKADTEKIKHCKDFLEINSGVLSGFQGNGRLFIVTKLTLAPSHIIKFAEISKIYNKLKKYFGGSSYLAYISAVLADMIPASEADRIAERGKRIYKLMSKKHPFLTSGEDSPFAILFAFSEKSDEELISLTEEYYERIKKLSNDRNTAQTLSHILALEGGEVEATVSRFETILSAIESRGRKYSRNYELSAIAALSLLPIDIDNAVDKIIEADNFLKEQKGYGFLGFDKKTRLMHAVMLVTDSYAEAAGETAVVTGTLAMVAAQQAAMCAIIATTAASTAAAAN